MESERGRKEDRSDGNRQGRGERERERGRGGGRTDSWRLSTRVGDRGFGASALENAVTSASSELQRVVMRKQTCIDERVSLSLSLDLGSAAYFFPDRKFDRSSDLSFLTQPLQPAPTLPSMIPAACKIFG